MAQVTVSRTDIVPPVAHLVERAASVIVLPIFYVKGSIDPATGTYPIYRVNLHATPSHIVRQMVFPKDEAGVAQTPYWADTAAVEYRPDCECMDFQGRAFLAGGVVWNGIWNGRLCKHTVRLLMDHPAWLHQLCLDVHPDKRGQLIALRNYQRSK